MCAVTNMALLEMKPARVIRTLCRQACFKDENRYLAVILGLLGC